MALNRRGFINRAGQDFAGLAAAVMLMEERARAEGSAAAELGSGGQLKALHHPPKARRVVQLFMAGAASHVDLWDYKPQLEKHHGEASNFGEHVEAFQDGLGPWMKSPFKFAPYGGSGKHLSDIVAPMGAVVDELAFVHNMVGKTGVHSQATYLQSTGFDRPGFPGMGAWVSYALGSLNDNLPTFVVLPDHRGFASNGPKNWGSGFLPASNQGTMIFPQRKTPIDDLYATADYLTPDSERDGQNLLRSLNQTYSRQRPGDSRLDSRLRSYELAGSAENHRLSYS